MPAKIHGLRSHKLYWVWYGMRRRCGDVNAPKYRFYGRRGISVCLEWQQNFLPFFNWAIANGYKPGLSIDRINTNGNYEPENCRFVTQKIQCNNSRRNHLLTIDGEIKTISEWADTTGIDQKLLWSRIFKNGWEPSRAIIPPTRGRNIEVCIDGNTITLKELAIKTGINHDTLWHRYKKGRRGDDLIAPVYARCVKFA